MKIMLVTSLIALLLFYVACWIVTYGMAFAFWQGAFPSIAKEHRRRDMGEAAMMAFFSPVSTFVVFFMTGCAEYGLKFR